jgi:hypothetical protein
LPDQSSLTATFCARSRRRYDLNFPALAGAAKQSCPRRLGIPAVAPQGRGNAASFMKRRRLSRATGGHWLDREHLSHRPELFGKVAHRAKYADSRLAVNGPLSFDRRRRGSNFSASAPPRRRCIRRNSRAIRQAVARAAGSPAQKPARPLRRRRWRSKGPRCSKGRRA